MVWLLERRLLVWRIALGYSKGSRHFLLFLKLFMVPRYKLGLSIQKVSKIKWSQRCVNFFHWHDFYVLFNYTLGENPATGVFFPITISGKDVHLLNSAVPRERTKHEDFFCSKDACIKGISFLSSEPVLVGIPYTSSLRKLRTESSMIFQHRSTCIAPPR